MALSMKRLQERTKRFGEGGFSTTLQMPGVEPSWCLIVAERGQSILTLRRQPERMQLFKTVEFHELPQAVLSHPSLPPLEHEKVASLLP